MSLVKQRIFILSIDGGGLRGIIPAIILDHIEKSTKKPVAQSFNLIAGTSTGGILGLALTVPDSGGLLRPKYSAGELVSLYKELGKRVFGPDMRTSSDDPSKTMWKRFWAWVERKFLKPKYKTDGLEDVLKERFGEVLLSQTVSDVLITSYDLHTGQPKLFKSQKAKSDDAQNYLMADVARATSAAPTFFSPLQIKNTATNLVDGGLILNDPSMAAYIEAMTTFVKSEDVEVILISIGTGTSLQPIRYEESKNWGAANWLQPVLYATMDGVSATTSYMLHSLAKMELGNLKYFRLNPTIDPQKSSMDDPAHMEYWEKVANDFLKENNLLIEQVVEALNTPESSVEERGPNLSI